MIVLVSPVFCSLGASERGESPMSPFVLPLGNNGLRANNVSNSNGPPTMLGIPPVLPIALVRVYVCVAPSRLLFLVFVTVR